VALTADQLAQVRRMISEPDDSNGYTDVILLAMAEVFLLDGVYNLRGLAGELWEQKAAATWELVQTSESGSSRAMQQAFEHAVTMAKLFREIGTGVETSASAPRSTRIVRPVREG
jgi:hypothetical protein